MLLTDAYGGHGGISRFNRDFLEAASAWEDCREVLAFPRLVTQEISDLIPEKVKFFDAGVTTKLSYAKRVLGTVAWDRSIDQVICGHLNLLPLAWVVSKCTGGRITLIVHGIDAWQPTNSRLTNGLCSKVAQVISVSALTLERFCEWTGIDPQRGRVLPNTVDLSLFTPGPKNPDLLDRYGFHGKRVLMTLGRIPLLERYKGYDEIIELMPRLLAEFPNIVYLIVGDGDDRPRLKEKAAALGVAHAVTFAGRIPEEEKVDHYRLADAYVMPSRGEGFGIVLLEAMSCGIPVMASRLDGSREALRGGLLGTLVDPTDLDDIHAGIRTTLGKPRGVPEGLDYFSHDSFRKRVAEVLGRPSSAPLSHDGDVKGGSSSALSDSTSRMSGR